MKSGLPTTKVSGKQEGNKLGLVLRNLRASRQSGSQRFALHKWSTKKLILCLSLCSFPAPYTCSPSHSFSIIACHVKGILYSAPPAIRGDPSARSHPAFCWSPVNVLETLRQDLTAHRVQRPGRNFLPISFCKEMHSSQYWFKRQPCLSISAGASFSFTQTEDFASASLSQVLDPAELRGVASLLLLPHTYSSTYKSKQSQQVLACW